MGKKTQGILERIYNSIDFLKSLKLGTLKRIKKALGYVIVVDVILIYWILQLKTIGIGIFIFLFILFGIILFLEGKKEKKTGRRST